MCERWRAGDKEGKSRRKTVREREGERGRRKSIDRERERRRDR